ncbi:YfhO family protein, partial [Candidatus Woesearchaeota archaeon]|nr:YfhO family protein [Candidatus Woesearchaeota archaeon]
TTFQTPNYILDSLAIPTFRLTGQDIRYVTEFFSISTDIWPYYRLKSFSLNSTYTYDLLNVKYIVSNQTLDYQGWRLFKELGNGYVYENSNVLPKAFIVGNVANVSPKDSLEMVSEPFNPREMAYAADGKSMRGTQPYAEPDITLYSPHIINIHATLTEPGYLVLTEPWYKFWQARIDGRPANVYRTNHMFMGVYVPAGEHDITFEYRNSLFQFGLFISLWTLAGILIVIVYILLFRNK